MTRIVPLVLAFAVCLATAAMAQFGAAYLPIKADDGSPIANIAFSAELSGRLAKLPGQVPVGNLQGDVTVVQFYDLNCPYCRLAAADVDALVRSDKMLKLMLVPYAVLSVQSVQGALIEIGASKMLTPERYLEFHRRIYANRGTIDGARVLAAAAAMGLDPNKLAGVANTESTLDVLRASADFGSEADLITTPTYVIGGVAILGHPGLKALQGLIQAMRSCGKAVC